MTQTTTTTAPRMFRDRREAGRVLAHLLDAYRGKSDVVVLGLARGGIPVAWEVAAALGAPLDAFIVRKLGAPGHDELALGAMALGGRVVINDDVVRALRVTPGQLRGVAEREGRELIRRDSAYRGDRPPVEVTGKTVILVDDGLATGASMVAAVQALREREPAQIVIAVPAAPESTWREFAGLVDDFVVATMPQPFLAVGESYWRFDQTTDEEVRQLLATPPPAAAAVAAESPADQVRRVSIDAPGGVPPREVLDDLIGDARVVLIGESSHGTHDFYQARADITKWLIEDNDFCAVAVEGDWPDAYRVNRFVRGIGDATADEALSGFQRFPTWMWRNTVVRDFADWLRERNQRVDARHQAGFYGLDLYSLHRSMQEVIAYLDTVDPEAAARARQRYSCFDHVSADDDGQAYGFAAAFGAGQSCEEQAIDQLVELQRNSMEYMRRDGLLTEDEQFYAERNAMVVHNAEAYYRTMFSGRVNSWNRRDIHMADTLDTLLTHLDNEVVPPQTSRIVVWAHNSHVGDARATEVYTDGQTTLGTLARQMYRSETRLIGFSTYTGTVTAASEWGGIAERKTVRPGLPNGIEELFHEAGTDALYVAMRREGRPAAEPLDEVRLARAIGVIYRPDTERQSHCFHVRPSEQFDAMIHIDNTRAVEPLDVTSKWIAGEVPETYPTGL